MSREDIQREVTDRVIAALEKGGLAEFTQPWAKLSGGGGGMPWNFRSGNRYRGANVMLLFMVAADRGYGANAWMTFNQVKELGGSVRKGEKGARVMKFTPKVLEGEAADTREATTRVVPMTKWYTVFNLDQCEGLDLSAFEPRPILDTTGKLAKGEILLQRMITSTGLRYQCVGNSACYHWSADLLKMPAGEFESVDCYVATLAHELVHSTSSHLRLGRREQISAKFPRSDEAYAFEELVAELGAAMICAEFGIVGEHLQHESYIASWLGALKKDKTLIFKAARYAHEAYCYLMGEAVESQDSPALDAAA
jgi:antirestriction protein ArdC